MSKTFVAYAIVACLCVALGSISCDHSADPASGYSKQPSSIRHTYTGPMHRLEREKYILEFPANPQTIKPGTQPGVLLLFHGGGLKKGTSKSMGWLCKKIVKRVPFTCLSASYYLSHRDEVGGGIRSVADARDAIRWVYDNADQLGIDRTLLVVGGSSAGGYLANTLGVISTTPMDPVPLPHISLVVSMNGSFDMRRMVNPKTSLLFPVAIQQAYSPADHLDSMDPEFMLIHGEDDRRIVPERVYAFAEALTRHGIPHTVHTLQYTGHSLTDESTKRKIVAMVEDKLNELADTHHRHRRLSLNQHE